MTKGKDTIIAAIVKWLKSVGGDNLKVQNPKNIPTSRNKDIRGAKRKG